MPEVKLLGHPPRNLRGPESIIQTVPAPAIEFVSQDGFSIAYSSAGEGIPFVFMPAPTNNIQLAWESENSLCQWMEELSARYQLVQFDWRGQGMSSRGLTGNYAMSDLLRDLDAVIQRLQLNQFILMGSHISAHTAARYAVSHPDRVRALILGPCGVSGSAWPVMNALDLARDNWQFFLMYYATTFMSDAAREAGDSPERTAPYEMNALTQSVTQSDWNIMGRVWCQSDIKESLANLGTPTLILHPRKYLNVPVERSAHLASSVRNARLVLIEGYTPLGNANSGVQAIEAFLNDLMITLIV